MRGLLWVVMALVSGADPAPVDLAALGPASRRPQHEAQDRKGIDALFQALDAALAQGNAAAYADTLDFPVTLVTDGPAGATSATLDREAFLKLIADSLKPPSHLKVTSKRVITVLSDGLATVVDETTLALGKNRASSKSGAVVVRRAEAWKIQILTEPGWAELLHPAAPAPPSP